MKKKINSLKKGKVGEYLFRKLAEDYGLEVINQAEDKNKPDIRLAGLDCEIKYRASIPSQFYRYLKEKNADILAIKRVLRGEKNDWLIVVPYTLFFQFLEEKKKITQK